VKKTRVSEERWRLSMLAMWEAVFIAGLVLLFSGMAEYWGTWVSVMVGAGMLVWSQVELSRLGGRRRE